MDGIIIINKEKNWTSNDIVQKLKGIFHNKTGHTGTLDPLATGVLPILVGKGTLISKYLVNHDKEYIATVKLGQKTSTGDSEGEVIENKIVTDNMLEKENVSQILRSFLGEQEQIPPMYSAIKVDGKKLYEYARKGQKVTVNPRKIEIYNIGVISISKDKKEITYKVNCSKGTYIRTLSEDIAEKLGTVGFTTNLQRTKVGDFTIAQSVKIEDITNVESYNAVMEKNFITIEQFFENKEKIKLDDKDLQRFLNGVNLNVNNNDDIYRIYDNNLTFIGTGIVNKNKLKRDIKI